MRVSIVTNGFPPQGGGGYGYRLADLRSSLIERGHEVTVVTSTGAVGGPRAEEGGVARVLTRVGEVHGVRGVIGLAAASLGDGRRLARSLRAFRPEVLLVGNFSDLSSALWTTLRRVGVPIVLDVSNEWLLDLCSTHGSWFRIWEKRSRTWPRRVLKGAVRLALDAGPAALSTRFPGFGGARGYATAAHLVETLDRAGGERPPPLRVAGSGIRLADFPFRAEPGPPGDLLYVGRLKPWKAVHTAIEALHHLDGSFRLTVVGVSDDREYEATLRRLAEPLGDRVSFGPPVPRGGIPELFGRHGALLFTSSGAEPFSRLVLEAFACGIPVVATPAGGTAEVLADRRNGLLFPAEDPRALAAAVEALRDDADLRESIVRTARADVESEYGLEAYAARVESILREAASSG